MCGCESWTIKKAECICLTSVDTLLWMTMFYTNFNIFQPNVLSFCPGSYPGPASTQSYISQASSALWEFLRLSLILMLTILSNSGQEFCTVFSSWLGWGRGSLGRRCRGGESFIPHPAKVTFAVSVNLTVERSYVSCEPLGRQPRWAALPEPWGQALAPENRVCVSSMESFCLGGASLLCCFLIQPLALICTGCRRWCWSADPAVLCFLSWSQGSLWPWPPQVVPPAFGSPCRWSLVLSTSVLCDPTSHSRSSCMCPARVLGWAMSQATQVLLAGPSYWNPWPGHQVYPCF